MKYHRIIAVVGAIAVSAIASNASWDEPAAVYFAKDRQQVAPLGKMPKQVARQSRADRALQNIVAGQRAKNREIIAAAARRHGVPVSLGLAVAHQETQFNHKLTSPVGAMGLTQVMPGTWRAEGCKGSPYDPVANADCGMKYLAKFYREGGAHYAAMRYHGGPNTRMHGPKTKHYARVVVAKSQTIGTVPDWAGQSPMKIAMWW